MRHIILVGLATLLSRLLGFVRELLFGKSLGAHTLSDAFLTALKIPNILYEISAGGSLGPAVVPIFLQVKHTGAMQRVNELFTALLAIFIASSSGVWCIIMSMRHAIVHFFAPGFSSEQTEVASLLLSIVGLLVIVHTVSALLCEMLRSFKQILLSATGHTIINIFWIIGLAAYWYGYATLVAIAWMIVAGGMVQIMAYGTTLYLSTPLRFARPKAESWYLARSVLWHALPCTVTSGIQEISLFIELQYASYLDIGTISLLTYASSFMRLPFGVFVYPLSLLLLPTLTRVGIYAPRRAGMIMSQMVLFMFWFMIPLTLLMGWFAPDIFYTLYRGSCLSSLKMQQLALLLRIKLSGLLCMSLNHLLIQLLYARKQAYKATYVSLITAGISIILNSLLTPWYGVYGIAWTAVMATIARTIIFMRMIAPLTIVKKTIMHFFKRGSAILFQTTFMTALLIISIECCKHCLCLYLPPAYTAIWVHGIGLWLWVGIMSMAAAYLMWRSRRLFQVRIALVDNTTY